MLDFGWPELFLIIGIAVLVIGPEQMPGILYKLGKAIQRIKYMRFALSRQFEEFMDQAEAHESSTGTKSSNCDSKHEYPDEHSEDMQAHEHTGSMPDNTRLSKDGTETPETQDLFGNDDREPKAINPDPKEEWK